MCGGDARCGAGARAPDDDSCRFVCDDEKEKPDIKPPQKQPSPAKVPNGIECVCFLVPSPGFKTQQLNGQQRHAKGPRGCLDSLLAGDVTGGCGGPAPPLPPTSVKFRDICEVPPHENQAIPYPRPAPSVELRGGHLYSGCQCVKRDGLQHDCPRTGCQGKPPCMAYPAPQCGPSGNAPPDDTPDTPKRRGRRGGGNRQQEGADQKGGYHPPGDDDPYVRKGRECYRENPPVKQGPRVPCREHRKTRC